VTDIGFGGAPQPTFASIGTPDQSTTRRASFVDTLAAEWIKLRSMRATTVTSGLTVLLAIGIGLLVSFFATPNFYGDAASESMGGLGLGQLVVAILGVMAITSEYGSGTIRPSLMAVPNRTRFFLAKILTVAVVCFVIGEVTAFGSFGIGQAILHSRSGVSSASLGQPHVFRAVFGAGLYLTALGLVGAAFGFIFRSTAVGIVLVVSMVFVIPIILAIIDHAANTHIEEYWPTEAGGQIFAINRGPQSPPVMAAWNGFADMVGFTVFILLVSWFTLTHRDA
jgi:ABC-type transport system involved in multi-copper enzyme maturation permease subunit